MQEKNMAIVDAKNNFPLDLIYAECKCCGSPLLWKKEHSLSILSQLNYSATRLSSSHCFISSTCPHCTPELDQHAIEILEVHEYMKSSKSDTVFKNAVV